ncbi:hypothetical protein OESDEN_02993 [Oesophagostomum dentatum]|uniref:Uncharacterized protein n=1 Tax=Oesophagostomum dentatum TaxID=61180 RepID=A0A0B1THL6_OESDE|nr:hypothetical protein OESDEN_02993 [Oesophagostomum dentatum]
MAVVFQVLHEYEPSENFRPEANPMVVVVFRKSKPSLKFSRTRDFDISKFMLDNDFADDLIGLALIIVGSDAFAIERQRLRGTVDNCHSLLRSSKSAPSPVSNQSSLICATFHVSNPHRCPVSTFTAAAPSLSLFLPLILALFLENQR